MNGAEIKAKLKEAKDLMKKEGETLKDAHQHLPQLSWMLFLKCFDDLEKTNRLRTRGYEEILPEELRWRTWATDKKITGKLLLKQVTELFEKFEALEPEKGKEMRNVFSTIFRKMPNRISDGYRFREILNIVNEISFSTKDDLNNFAQVYKDELVEMVSSSDNPYYYTPRAVAKFIVTAVNPDFTKGDRVFDPASGFGGFMIESLQHMEKLEDSAESRKQLRYETIHANEKDVDTFVCGILNMMVNGIWSPNYSLVNSLSKHTRDFSDDFAASLSRFDEILLLDIYPAREKPIKGITSEWLLGKIDNPNKKMITEKELLKAIKNSSSKIVAMLGAGDIGLMIPKIAEELLKSIENEA